MLLFSQLSYFLRSIPPICFSFFFFFEGILHVLADACVLNQVYSSLTGCGWLLIGVLLTWSGGPFMYMYTGPDYGLGITTAPLHQASGPVSFLFFPRERTSGPSSF